MNIHFDNVTSINGYSLNVYENHLCYKNPAICMYIGPANWAAVLTGNYRIIKTAEAHYKIFTGLANYIANIMIAYLAVQHFTFAFPQFNIMHLCRSCIFLGFDKFFTDNNI